METMKKEVTKKPTFKKKRANVFCEVEFLNGKKKIFQFPNDLRSAMISAHKQKELSKTLVGALINVPISAYKSNGQAKLDVAKITKVFVKRHQQTWRTRGQFLTQDAWTNKLSWSQVKFLLHDHSFFNKLRIASSLFRWKQKHRKSDKS